MKPKQTFEVRMVSIDFPESDPLRLSLRLFIVFEKI